ncbi:hypothetical protein KSS87_021848 [Heliosperma pusillum]|nr:hypothetical protein KSS87_021848 [Heliosperma pusillum]
MEITKTTTFSIIVLVVLIIQLASAKQHEVGGSPGWDESTDYDTWAKSQTFKVGDTLVFKYATGIHDVVELGSESEYKKCDINNAANSFNGGSNVVKLDKVGTRYFTCGTSGHCIAGMKLMVNVVAADSSPPSSSPPSPSPSSPSSSSSPSPSSSSSSSLPSSTSSSSPPSPSPSSSSPSSSSPSSSTSNAFTAIQYDDDDDYYVDRTVRNRGGDLTVDSQGSRNKRGVQWVVLGQPGAKKHVYADKLSKLLDVPHISMASLLLQELHPHSSVYQQIKNAVSQGKLVPEDIIFGLLSKRLEEGYYRGESGFILDGIPRTRMQAEVLDQIVDIDLVLNFKNTVKAERKLVTGLNIHSQGSQMKSLSSEAAQREKLRTYAEQSKLLEDFYRRQNKLLDFEVDEGLGETWHDLLSVLQLQHIKSSFQTLTA